MAEAPTHQSSLPVLEKRCDECEGRGGREPMYTGGWDPCWKCLGVGHLPTDEGKRLLEFLAHHAPHVYRATLCREAS